MKKKAVKRKIILLVFLFILLYLSLLLVFITVTAGKPFSENEISLDLGNFYDFEINKRDFIDKYQVEKCSIKRSITLTCTDTSVTGIYDLTIPPDHKIASFITSGEIYYSIDTFFEVMFGEMRINNTTIYYSLKDITWTIDSKSKSLHIIGTFFYQLFEPGVHIYYSYPYDEYRKLEFFTVYEDLLDIKYNNLKVFYIDPQPEGINVSKNSITFNPYAVDDYIYLFLSPENFITSWILKNDPTTDITSKQSGLKKLDEIISMSAFGNLGNKFLLILPFLIFIIWVYKSGTAQNKPVKKVTNISITLIVFYAMYIFKSLFQFIPRDFIRSLIALLRLDMDESYVGLIVSSGKIMVIGLIAPIIIYNRVKHDKPKTKVLHKIVSAIIPFIIPLIVLGLIITFVFSFNDSHDLGFYFEQTGVPVFFLISLIVFGIIFWVINYLISGKIKASLFYSIIMCNIASLLPFIINITIINNNNFKSFALMPVAPIIGFFFLFMISLSVIEHIKDFNPGMVIKPWVIIVVIVSIVVLIIPINIIKSGERVSIDYNYFFNIGNMVYRSIKYFWLVGIIYLLYKESKDNQEITPIARFSGILGTSVLLFSISNNWMAIPITFLLGWYALSKFVRPEGYKTILGNIYDSIFAKRAYHIDKLLDLTIAEKFLHKVREKSGKKLLECDDDYSINDYAAQFDKHEAQFNALEAESEIAGFSIKETVLNIGPLKTSWQNGMHGAKIALIFSIPWLYLYFKQRFLNAPVDTQTFLLWDFINVLMVIFFKFSILGFFMGYFYPYLYGKNGFQKGFYLFVIAIVPHLPLLILNNITGLEWYGTLFWAIQFFIQCTVIGMVGFDLVILHQSKFHWKMIFFAYGLPMLGASISSLLIAGYSTIFALLNTHIDKIISTIFESIFSF